MKERRENDSMFSIGRFLSNQKTPQAGALTLVQLVDRHFASNHNRGRINARVEQFAKRCLIVAGRGASAALPGLQEQRAVKVRRGDTSLSTAVYGVVTIDAVHSFGRQEFVVSANLGG